MLISKAPDGCAALVGESPAMRAVFGLIELLRATDATVLITGESGTGKEVVARAIHAASPRSAGPFVPVHCAALMDSLVESELFGYVPGAFTGATRDKQGLIARADGGTLFLDGVGEASLQAQCKLERFLAEGEIVPVGATSPTRVDARIIATSNIDITEGLEAGRVRRELYYRLDVVPLRLPPLRERREDIPLFVAHFLRRAARRGQQVPREVSRDAMQALTSYAWPGNVRELQNVVERTLALHARATTVGLSDLPEELQRAAAEPAVAAGPGRMRTYQAAVAAAERAYFREVLRRSGGNVSEVARIAALSRGHLHRKLGQLGLDPAEFRVGAR